MPIIASLGALTYNKTGLVGVLSDYWAIRAINDTICNDIFLDSTNNLFYTFGDGWNSVQIAGFTNPAITNNKTWDLTTTNSANGEKLNYSSGSNLLVGIGYGTMPYAPVFPYYTVTSGLLTTINPSTYATTSYYSYPQYGAPPIGNGNLRKHYVDFIIDSNNNYYIVGTDTSYFGSTNFRNFVTIWKLNSSLTFLSNTRINDTFTGYFSNSISDQAIPAIALDSNDNPILSYGFRESNASTLTKIVLRKMNKTETGSPAVLSSTWQVGVIPSGTESVQCSGLKIDSSGNIYASYRVVGSVKSYLIKYDSSGTIIWQQSIGILIDDIQIKSSTEIYLGGRYNTTTGNLWVAKINDSGVIQFQRQFGTSFWNNQTVSLILNNNNLYVNHTYYATGTPNLAQCILIKVQDDGTIPGTGSYTFSDGKTMTYSSASASFTTTTLSTWIPSSSVTGINDNALISESQNEISNSNNRYISFL